MRVDGPLSGICHWFTHPDRSQSRGHVTRYHAGDADTLDIVHRYNIYIYTVCDKDQTIFFE